MSIMTQTYLIKRQFEASASNYDNAAILQREVCDRLISRLDYMQIAPQRILDLGSGTGYLTRALKNKYPKADIIGLDIAFNMAQTAKSKNGWFKKIHYTNADCQHLPFKSLCFDLILSANTLQWCENIEYALQECQRILKPSGLFLFSSFGPDTLKELKLSWAAADALPHVNSFLDMHDYGDMLLHHQFDEPVMDVEYLTIEYEHPKQLLKDLKMLGANNVHPERRKTLTGKSKLLKVIETYEQFKRENNSYPATYEIVYGHALKPKRQTHYQGGTLTIPLESTGLITNKD